MVIHVVYDIQSTSFIFSYIKNAVMFVRSVTMEFIREQHYYQVYVLLRSCLFKGYEPFNEY